MTVVLEYPSPSTYVRAVQIKGRLAESLRTYSTRDSVVAGLPQSFSGANAIVFPMDDGQKSWALRFFTNANAADSRRYSALERFQQDSGHEWPAKCSWVDQAIRIGDDWFPGLRMELIEGVLLDQYVLQLAAAKDSAALEALAKDWRRMLNNLQSSGFAHGDLQHGNVLVERSTGSLRLVDFDGIWLGGLADDPPSERGHGSYQHPGRLGAEHWGPLVDSFGGLVVYLTLKALAHDPTLSRHTVVGSHLLITEEEMRAVSGPDAPVLSELNASPNGEVAALARLLQSWLAGPPNRNASLDELIELAVADQREQPSGPPASGPSEYGTSPLSWWQQADGTTPNKRTWSPGPGSATTAAESDESEDVAPSADTTPAGASPRPLPSIGDIQGQVAMASSRSTPLPTGDSTSDWIESVSGHAAEGSGVNHHAGLVGGNAAAEHTKPAQGEIIGRRVLAALIDGAVGLFLLLHLVWLTEAQAPGKRAGGLVVRRTSGDRPSFGRLVIRELVLKQVAINLAVLGAILGNGLLVTLPLCWLVAGSVSGLGPSGRTLWDLICDTEVVPVEAGGAETASPSSHTPGNEQGGIWW